MKRISILLSTVLYLTLSDSAEIPVKERIERERWVLNYLRQIVFTGKYTDQPHPLLPDVAADDFTKAGVLENLKERLERGFLPNDEVFSFLNMVALLDTVSLCDVLYFAKDFNTFKKVAEWGKTALHPMQMSYCFYVAVFHRADTKTFRVPPVYQVYPNFFVPSKTLKHVFSSYAQGVKKERFDVNNTGYEWSWHQNMIINSFQEYDRWKADDVNSKFSYFREDVNLGNWMSYFYMHFPFFVSSERYPELKDSRKGERLVGGFDQLLRRYNMERNANWFTQELPVQFNKPLIGYNTHLSDLFGRGIPERNDNLVPIELNYQEVRNIEDNLNRYKETINLKTMWQMGTNYSVKLEGRDGVGVLGRNLFGTADSISPLYYGPLYFQILSMIEGMVKANNERQMSTTAVSRIITVQRDPVMYKALTNIKDIINMYTDSLPPYTTRQLEVPGVEIEGVEFSHLETYFERFEFDISNAVPMSEGERPDYKASTVRLNHKPFSYAVKVKSDRDVDVAIKIYLGPVNDNDYRPLTLNQAREGYYTFDAITTKLKAGENEIKVKSTENQIFKRQPSWEELNQELLEAEKNGTPPTPIVRSYSFPENLMLPRGWAVGALYSILTVVTETNSTSSESDQYFPIQFAPDFPIDRNIVEKNFRAVKNIHMSKIRVYHKTEQTEI